MKHLKNQTHGETNNSKYFTPSSIYSISTLRLTSTLKAHGNVAHTAGATQSLQTLSVSWLKDNTNIVAGRSNHGGGFQ